MTGAILALDTATVSGFAYGRPGERPTWGAWNSAAPTTGAMLHKFREQLLRLCDSVQPTLIVFESPYVPREYYQHGPPINATTLRRLFALAGIVEEVACGFGVECYEAPIGEISKFFLGSAKQGGRAAKKAATIKMCRLYGWVTDSDDAADALALWSYAEHTIAPRIGSQRHASAGRELPLHGLLTHPP